jgi:hypothetical protein
MYSSLSRVMRWPIKNNVLCILNENHCNYLTIIHDENINFGTKVIRTIFKKL